MRIPQTDLLDQNLLNFLPIGEHSDVYKALSTHPTDPESLNTDFLKSKYHSEKSHHDICNPLFKIIQYYVL